MNYFSFNFVLLNISIFSICFCYIVEYECSTTVRYKRHTTSYENYINGNKERSGINSSIKYWIISTKFVLRKYRQSWQRNYYDATVSPSVCRRFAAFSEIFTFDLTRPFRFLTWMRYKTIWLNVRLSSHKVTRNSIIFISTFSISNQCLKYLYSEKLKNVSVETYFSFVCTGMMILSDNGFIKEKVDQNLPGK